MFKGTKYTVGAFAILVASATPLQAKDFRVQVSANVPISCEASISGGFSEISHQQFRLGRINQFCNTGYQMSFSYSGGVNGAEFRVRDTTAEMMLGSTLITSFGRPINAANDIYLSNIDRDSAQIIASTLNVSVTPTGL